MSPRYPRRWHPVLPPPPLDVESLRRGISEERSASEIDGIAIATEVRTLAAEGLFEIFFDPLRVRSARGTAVIITEDYDSGVVAAMSRPWKGKVIHVDAEAGIITARITKSKRPLKGDRFRIKPYSFLSALAGWANDLKALPEMFEGLERALLHDTVDTASAEGTGLGLSPSQQNAVRLSQRDLFLLWGPPGTGKTYTLGEIAARRIAAGDTVVGLSTTNVAVDLLTLSIDNAFAARGDGFRPGDLIRAGRPQLPALVEDESRGHLLLWTQTLREYAAKIHEVRDDLSRIEQALQRSVLEELGLRLRTARAQLLEELEGLQAERAKELKLLAAHAKIVTTTFSTYIQNRTLFGRSYDWTIVDEASMVPLAAAVRLLGDSRKGFLFGGDFMQLPPISRAKRHARFAAPWMGASLFNHAGVTEVRKRERYARSGALAMLTEQRRMQAPICEFISSQFYDGKLSTVEGPPEVPAGCGWPRAALLIVDPAQVTLPPGGAPTSGRPMRGRPMGWLWDRSAAVARLLVEMLLATPGAWPQSILVCSPFRQQAALLQRLIEPLDPDRVRAGTIHRMQGNEATVVIVDPVYPRSPFLNLPDSAPRLVNVAVSRARSQVIVLGSADELEGSAYLAPLTRRAMPWIPGAS